MTFIIQWLIMTVAVIVTAYLLAGVTVSGIGAAVVTALVLGIINAFIRPVLLALTLPLNILTLGLFTFVINAILIMLAGSIVPGFAVKNFWWALLFSIVLTIVLYAINSLWS
ncbi:MAG: phage holin family protein [bacterium]|nr:phage holin family protein [bacterium]